MSDEKKLVPAAGQPPQPVQGTAQPQRGRPPLPMMVEAMRELITLGTDNPRMSEAVFPDFLRGLYNPATDTFNREMWMLNVGNMRRGLDIIDGSGKVIRTCPPLTATVRTRMGPSKDASGRLQPTMNEIADKAALHGRRHAPQEAKVFNEGISAYKPEVAFDAQALWRAILEDYGIIPKAGVENSSGLSAESLLSDDGDAL